MCRMDDSRKKYIFFHMRCWFTVDLNNGQRTYFFFIFWSSVKILPFWKFRFKTGLLLGGNAGLLFPNLWPARANVTFLCASIHLQQEIQNINSKERNFVRETSSNKMLLLLFTSHLMLAGAGLMLRARESLADSRRTSRGSWLLPCRGGTTTSDQAVGSLTTSFTTAATP